MKLVMINGRLIYAVNIAIPMQQLSAQVYSISKIINYAETINQFA